MSAANSPSYKAGRVDGTIDAGLIGLCPPQPPVGPTPPNADYPVMYLRGYHEVFDVAVAHQCTEECKK